MLLFESLVNALKCDYFIRKYNESHRNSKIISIQYSHRMLYVFKRRKKTWTFTYLCRILANNPQVIWAINWARIVRSFTLWLLYTILNCRHTKYDYSFQVLFRFYFKFDYYCAKLGYFALCFCHYFRHQRQYLIFLCAAFIHL